MIETTGEGKSAVAIPDGKSRNKKKKKTKLVVARKLCRMSTLIQPCICDVGGFFAVGMMALLGIQCNMESF